MGYRLWFFAESQEDSGRSLPEATFVSKLWSFTSCALILTVHATCTVHEN